MLELLSSLWPANLELGICNGLNSNQESTGKTSSSGLQPYIQLNSSHLRSFWYWSCSDPAILFVPKRHWYGPDCAREISQGLIIFFSLFIHETLNSESLALRTTRKLKNKLSLQNPCIQSLLDVLEASANARFGSKDGNVHHKMILGNKSNERQYWTVWLPRKD